METNSSSPAKVAAAVSRLVAILAQLSVTDQHRAMDAAYAVLGTTKNGTDEESQDQDSGKGEDSIVKVASKNDHTDQAKFFDRGDRKSNPAKNAFLCAAWHFKRHGMAAFSISEIKEIATQAGVIIPDRVDMTLKNAGKRGKRLFVSGGKQLFRPTASGGHYLQTEFGVRPAGRLRC